MLQHYDWSKNYWLDRNGYSRCITHTFTAAPTDTQMHCLTLPVRYVDVDKSCASLTQSDTSSTVDVGVNTKNVK